MKEKLVRSIVLTIAANLAAQAALFGAATVAYGVAGRWMPPFGIVSLAFCAIVGAGLVALRGNFVIEATGRRLDRVNLANRVTLVRICSLPTILFMILAARDAPPLVPLLLAVTAIAFLTDLIDGKLSRKLAQVTKMGRMLDSTSDYCLLIVISIAFRFFALIPTWFFVLVLFRLVAHAAMMVALAAAKGKIDTESSFLGKAAIASVMVLYGCELIRLLLAQRAPLGDWDICFRVLEWLVAGVLVVSVFDKAVLLVRAFRRIPEEKKEERADRS